MRWLLALLFVIGGASSAAAQPQPGIYRSRHMGGSCSPGRLSLSWQGPHRANDGLGGVLNCGSLDGTTFGGQWLVHCAQQGLPGDVSGGMDNYGNGLFVYRSRLSGGHFVLAPGTWGTGGGQITSVEVIDSTWYFSSLWSRSIVHLEADGRFDHGPFTFHLSVGLAPAITTDEVISTDYPPFLDDGCSPNRQNGIYADVEFVTITVTLDRLTPVLPSTWGQLKAAYR